MQRDEPTNLLRLSTALKIFCGSSVQLELLPRAEVLLQEYLLEFKRMYGEGSMKPNFHWAVHLAQQIRDYGPVYNFWAFLSERLNKVLKSSNSNNWTGGQVEISMMREFMRAGQIDSMARGALQTTQSPIIESVLKRMLGEGQEALGTVQDAAGDIELDGMSCALIHCLATYTRDRITKLPACPAWPRIHAPTATQRQRPSSVTFAIQCTTSSQPLNPPPQSLPLNDFAVFYDFALLDGRRITPASKSTRESFGSSLIKARVGPNFYYGEIISIFSHVQPNASDGSQLQAEFRWMKELALSPVQDDPWSEFPELNVTCFALNEFWGPQEAGSPPCVLPFDCITCQIARGVVTTTNPQMWITTSLDKVR
ncbi:hypothetical protein DEU56DRAFT_745134 [Suillus clintonianus]|uniref:uncharacterized protein n=1 Tax=Suillus clintonianus TaxID=1904413 RepID=UPI001B87F4D8|nr:uncharacterized protein DEU56DRAFT_745134 [Suillus clintonianus]KAG2123732.1 hypothetical protein DEU56DRAFT_745134 [Suillus clintonianus]